MPRCRVAAVPDVIEVLTSNLSQSLISLSSESSLRSNASWCRRRRCRRRRFRRRRCRRRRRRRRHERDVNDFFALLFITGLQNRKY